MFIVLFFKGIACASQSANMVILDTQLWMWGSQSDDQLLCVKQTYESV